MILLIQYMLIFASVLMLVALGGCFSEHSGVINIGLEGIMVFGALGGALMMKWLPVGASALAVISLSILAAVIFGMLYSLLLAVAAINFSADQTLVGTAMTGQSTRPPMTLARAPSMPATAMTTRAVMRGSRLLKRRCSPATPTSYSRVTRLPRVSAVMAASSATPISLVPPVATTMLPRPSRSFGRATARRDRGS